MATRSNGRTSSILERMPHATDTPDDATVEVHSPPEPSVPVERIAEGEIPYNRRVCRERAEAEQRLAIAAAAMQSWWQFVKEKYGLAEADVVDAEGNITRA
jgi:hypothetical protein